MVYICISYPLICTFLPILLCMLPFLSLNCPEEASINELYFRYSHVIIIKKEKMLPESTRISGRTEML